MLLANKKLKDFQALAKCVSDSVGLDALSNALSYLSPLYIAKTYLRDSITCGSPSRLSPGLQRASAVEPSLSDGEVQVVV